MVPTMSTWNPDPYTEPPERPPMDQTSKVVLAGVIVLAGICFVILIAMMAGGGGGKVEAVAAPVLPEPAPTVTVTATPQPAPTVYVTQAPPQVQVPQTVPLEQAGPSEDDVRRQRSLCYDALSSSTQLPPQSRWTLPCQTAFPNTDPGQFMYREQPFVQRLRSAERTWNASPGPDIASFGWRICSISQSSPELDRSGLAERAGAGGGRFTTSDFLPVVNAAFDALCPEAENRVGAGGGYGNSGAYSRPGYGA